MATRTVNQPRAHALVRRIATLDAEPARREAVALGLVDALTEGDDETLAAALDALRDARAHSDADQELSGWLDAALAIAHWGVERMPSKAAVVQGTQAHDFLRMLDGSPQVGSTELRRLLETDETQVSRTGRRLLESGLVTRRKVGRQVFWQLTPRGRRGPAPTRSPGPELWQQAIRRGFEAASGDEPRNPREVDPTRERIISYTLDLHQRQGIQATTWTDIANAAGIPVQTMRELFPTDDDLVRSCAEHFMESLRLPPVDRAPEIFAGASSENERVHRLIETLFDVYERAGDGLAVGRRERKDLPTVDESFAAVEDSFDALVAEAVRPQRPDTSSVAPSLRALTDLEVWRTLRDQGATPEGAVDQASATVERWLTAQPAH
jgi:AcrR family transcriptional regulator